MPFGQSRDFWGSENTDPITDKDEFKFRTDIDNHATSRQSPVATEDSLVGLKGAKGLAEIARNESGALLFDLGDGDLLVIASRPTHDLTGTEDCFIFF